jgi:hypothetical protein
MYPLGHNVSEISSTGMTRGFAVDVEKLQERVERRELPRELFDELLTMAVVVILL